MKAIISSRDRIEVAEQLNKKAKEIGIESVFSGSKVLDIPMLGMTGKAIYGIKNRLGVPTGCGVHNMASQWKGLKWKLSHEDEFRCQRLHVFYRWLLEWASFCMSR